MAVTSADDSATPPTETLEVFSAQIRTNRIVSIRTVFLRLREYTGLDEVNINFDR